MAQGLLWGVQWVWVQKAAAEQPESAQGYLRGAQAVMGAWLPELLVLVHGCIGDGAENGCRGCESKGQLHCNQQAAWGAMACSQCAVNLHRIHRRERGAGGERGWRGATARPIPWDGKHPELRDPVLNLQRAQTRGPGRPHETAFCMCPVIT